MSSRSLDRKSLSSSQSSNSFAERKLSVQIDDKRVQTTYKPSSAKDVDMSPLPSFTNSDPREHETLAIKKLQQCCVTYDFIPHTKGDEKRMKSNTLIELREFMSQLKLTSRLYSEMASMVAANIFRSFPFAPMKDQAILDGDNIFEEIGWVHLHLVYDVFLRFLDRKDFDPALATCFDEKFLNNFMDVFSSGDPRERKMLKNVLHRLYAKLVSKRSYIRNRMCYMYLKFIYENEHVNGICELLETSASIANGFVLPLKQEHTTFLKKILIPLHKTGLLQLYHAQLKNCITQFIEKQPSLIVDVIRGILKFWPVQNSSKQVLFLDEIEYLIDGIDPASFDEIQKLLFSILAQCISSENAIVSQRALLFWKNEDFQDLVESRYEDIMPVMFPVFYRVSKSHWNSSIKKMVDIIMEKFHLSGGTTKLYEDLLSQCEQNAK